MPESNNPRWSLEDLPFNNPQALDTAQSQLENLVLDFESVGITFPGPPGG